MESKTTEHPHLTGAPATVEASEPAGSPSAAGTPLPLPELPLTKEMREVLNCYEDTKATFQKHQDQLNTLQARADRQMAMAAEAEAEAEQHKAAVFELIRSETEDKEALRNLTAKQETALSLAAQYRSFADEIRAEMDALKPAAMVAARDYYAVREGALLEYAKFVSNAILEEIGERLLQAFAVQRLAYSATNLTYRNGHKMPIFENFTRDFENRLKGFALDITVDGILSELAKRPNIAPFAVSDISNPLNMLKIKQKIEGGIKKTG